MRLDRGAKRILIADDSTTYRAVLEEVLSEAGYEVSVVTDGEQLLTALEKGTDAIDLLVLELNLPKVRGIDVLRKVREEGEIDGTPVLVITDFLSEHLKKVLSDLGAVHYVNKYHALRSLLYQVDGILFKTDHNERRSERKLGHLPVNYWLDDNLYLQYCFDISADGMFIIVTEEEPPPTGTVLTLRFWLPTSEKLVAAKGEVVWLNCSGDGLRISHPPGMGLRFLGLEAEDCKLVADFVSSL